MPSLLPGPRAESRGMPILRGLLSVASRSTTCLGNGNCEAPRVALALSLPAAGNHTGHTGKLPLPFWKVTCCTSCALGLWRCLRHFPRPACACDRQWWFLLLFRLFAHICASWFMFVVQVVVPGGGDVWGLKKGCCSEPGAVCQGGKRQVWQPGQGSHRCWGQWTGGDTSRSRCRGRGGAF